MVDNKLKFHEQCSAVIAKINKLLRMICRSFEYTDMDMIFCLYKSLIRPVIEYGNIIWGPYYIMDQQATEIIQRRVTKLIPDLRHFTYKERLCKLSRPSLFTDVKEEK